MAHQTDILDKTAENVPTWDRDIVTQGIQYLASLGAPFSADDLHALGIPLPPHPNHIGALFSAARKAGIIQPLGYIPSQRAGRNGSVVRTWVGV